ncbi:hypothetical protein BH09ACT6_BH09ACT6_22500 [soil metagenome]
MKKSRLARPAILATALAAAMSLGVVVPAAHASDCHTYSRWYGDSSHSNASRQNPTNVYVRAYVTRNYGGHLISALGSWGTSSSATFTAGTGYESWFYCYG